jgi:nucleotide-binding universal stress UspA family protein
MPRVTARPVQIPEQQKAPVRRPRIAVGTDGSEWGTFALDWALRHASLVNAKLHVFAAETSDNQVIARRLRAYRWLHAAVAASPDCPVRTMIAASLDNDLLVLGHRGHQHGPFGLGRSILPIITAAHCDIVIVRGEARAVRGEHCWVTAAIGGAHDDLVLRRAVRAAGRTRSGLRLVHAVPIPAARRVTETTDPAGTLEHAGDLARRLAPGLTPSLTLARSQPHEAVRACPRSDLLVMGPGGRRGRLSMTTSTALHLASCPVLVVEPW